MDDTVKGSDMNNPRPNCTAENQESVPSSRLAKYNRKANAAASFKGG